MKLLPKRLPLMKLLPKRLPLMKLPLKRTNNYIYEY
jgi:hypothetical protein